LVEDEKTYEEEAGYFSERLMFYYGRWRYG